MPVRAWPIRSCPPKRDGQGEGLDGEGALDADGGQCGHDPRVGAELAEGRCLRLDRGVGGQRVGNRRVLGVDRGVGDHAVRIIDACTGSSGSRGTRAVVLEVRSCCGGGVVQRSAPVSGGSAAGEIVMWGEAFLASARVHGVGEGGIWQKTPAIRGLNWDPNFWTIRRGDARTVRRHSSRAAYRRPFYLLSGTIPGARAVRRERSTPGGLRHLRTLGSGAISGASPPDPGWESPRTGGKDGAA